MAYTNWQAKERGEKVISHTEPGENDEGYYRKDIKVKGENGVGVYTESKPVAYWLDGGVLVGSIGCGSEARYMTPNEMADVWTYVCNKPISYKAYREACAIEGVWWAQNNTAAVIALQEPEPAPVERVITRTHNNPPEDLPLHQQHAQAIDTALAAAADWFKPGAIKTLEDAELAAGTKNRIGELRLAADKAGRAIYDPIFRQYSEIRDTWNPIVHRAKTAETELNSRVLAFREQERRRIAAERAEIERLAAEQFARDARAADRAIATGVPEQAPVAQPEPVLPVQAPLVPTTGRKPRETMKKFATIVDQAKVYEHFKGHADLIALLHKMAETEVRAGRDVQGVTVREGLI